MERQSLIARDSLQNVAIVKQKADQKHVSFRKQSNPFKKVIKMQSDELNA